MKIVFFGDSITDACKIVEFKEYSYGNGFLGFVAGNLLSENPLKYEIINKGISGNRTVDLYARIQKDVWEEKPDVLNILIGINDLWHQITAQNGVKIARFEKVYRSMIEETLEILPNVKIILCEPFVLKGEATENEFEKYQEVREYAKIVKKLAEEYNLFYLPLQELLDKKSEEYAPECWLWDGVHPTRAGAKIIADEWLSLFKKEIDK